MIPKIDRSEAPLSIDKLEDVERRFSIRLPDEYRDFLLQYNGGKPKPAVFRFKFEKGAYTDSCIDWFLAIYDGEYDNFETYFELYKIERSRLPTELVPIAHDPGGNLVCIAVNGPNVGAIYFWDHENEPDDKQSPSYANAHLIAYTFNEFLENLTDTLNIDE